jgi:hypothetical protein
MDRTQRLWGANVRPATALAALAIVVVLGYGVASQGDGNDSSTVSVASRLPGAGASLELAQGSATLEAHGVPKPPAGSIYQVWVQSGSDAPEASSAFRPGADGAAAVVIPGGVDAGDLVTVTREHGAGSPSPSSRPVFAAQIPR